MSTDRLKEVGVIRLVSDWVLTGLLMFTVAVIYSTIWVVNKSRYSKKTVFRAVMPTYLRLYRDIEKLTYKS